MSKVTDISSNAVLAKSCLQRKLYLNYLNQSIPHVRRDITSPYPANTQFELDMRRKAEILKYNYQSSKVGKTTRAQRWTILNNNATAFNRNNRCIVPDNQIIYTPSTSSDVPGPMIQLYEDPSIPLYKFIGKQQDEPENVFPYPDYTELFNVFPNYHPTFQKSKTSGVADIILINPTKTYYIAEFMTPFAITIQGVKTPVTQNNPIDVTYIKVSIIPQGIPFSLFYSDASVNLLTPPTTKLYQKSTVTDVSFVEMVIDVSNTSGSFYASQYVGNVKTTNVNMLSQKQYVYSLNYLFQYNIEEYNSNGIITATTGLTVQNPTIKMVANILGPTDEYANVSVNCTSRVTDTSNNIIYQPFYYNMV
jgi:hypothetical protein